MVCLNFLPWAFVCHLTAFATVQRGSFCLAVVHLSLSWLVGLGVGPLRDRGLACPGVPES